MKKQISLLLLSLLMTSALFAQQTLLGYFSFPTQTQAPNTPTSFTADGGAQSGTATIYADGTHGSSTFTTTELNMFAGTTLNNIADTGATSTLSLVYQNTSSNNKSIVIALSTTGYQNIILSFATRGTGTGFNTHAWAYSTDGASFTPLAGNNTAVTASTFALKTVDFSSITALNDQETIYLRLTVSGGSGANGNNRLDNIQINAVAGGPDVTAPKITSTNVISASSVALTFDEPLNQTIAENTSNYIFTGGVTASSAVLSPSNTVTLTMTPDLTEGTEYTLTVSNIEDTTGNVMADSSMILTYGIPTANWVTNISELKTKMTLDPNTNTVGTTIYKLTGEVVITTTGSQRNQKWIQDGTGAVLIDDPSGIITTTLVSGDKVKDLYGTLTNYYGLLEFVPTENITDVISQGNSVSPLSITTTQLKDASFMDGHQSELILLSDVIFTDANGTLTFTDGKKYRLNPGASEDTLVYLSISGVVTGVIPSNVQNITGISTFSRGKYYIVPRSNADIVNADDTFAPEITDFEVTSANSIIVTFSEELDQTIAENAVNYTLTGGITVSTAALVSRTVTLTLDQNITIGTEYTLTVQNIQDLSGNIMADSSITFTYTIPAPEITNYDVASATSIELTFNEEVDQTIAETVANYTLTGGITVSTATLNSNTVTLTLTPAMTSGTEYTLTVSNIQNQAGVIMPDSLIIFTYTAAPVNPTLLAYFSFPTLAASPNTPTSILADGGAQANTAGLYLNGTYGSSSWTQNGELNSFAGTTMNGITGEVALQALALVNQSANGKSAVFHFSTTGFQDIALSFAMMRTGTGFDNHVWSYSTDGSSYTPITGNNTGNIAASTWTVQTVDLSSISALIDQEDVYIKLTVSGASAGSGNNRFDNIQITGLPAGPDVTAPQISSTEIINAGSLSITFNEAVDQTIAENTGNYTLTGGVTVSAAVLTSNTVTLTLTPDMTVGTEYTLTVQNIQDIAGNIMPDSSITFTYSIPVPELTDYEIVSATTVELTFNEDLDQTIAETATNYIVTGGITVSAAALSSNTVTLTLTPAMTSGTQYTLTISNIQNLTGGIMPDSSITFTYTAAPVSPTLLAYFSFPTLAASPNTPTSILANGGSQANVAGLYANGTHGSSSWTQNGELNSFGGTTVNGVTGEVATQALALVNQSANGKSVVYHFSTKEFQDIVLSFAVMRSASGFNNHVWSYSTDGSVFTPISDNNTGNIAASTWVLQRLDLSSISDINDQENVYIKVTLSGASSASANNRFDNIQITGLPLGPDVYPPTITHTEIASPSSITLTFNELLNQSIAENIANYTLTNGISVSTASLTNKTVTLTLTPAMTEGVEYDLTISNIQDTTGNIMPDSTMTITFGVPSSNWVANIAELKTKMALNPDESTVGNITYKLTGEVTVTAIGSQRSQKWIQDGTGAVMIDDPNGKITTTMVIGDNIKDIYGTVTNYYGLLEFVPTQNVASVISQGNTVAPLEITTAQLKDATYMVQHQSELIKLSNATFSDANGTLTFANGKKYRLNPGTTTDSLVYLSIYNVVTGVIPSGEQDITGINTLSRGVYYIVPRNNSDITASPDMTAPEITTMQTVSATSIKLTFSEPLNQTIAETATNYTITGGITVSAASLASNSVTLTLNPAMTAEDEYTLTVSNIEDIAGNVMADSSITFTYHAPVSVANISELRTKMTLNDGEITTGTTIYKLTGEVTITATGSQRGQKWIQDAGAAVVIDDPDGIITTTMVKGDNIKDIYGTLTNYYGLLQFVPTQNVPSIISQGNQIIPLVVTSDELKDNSFMVDHQSKLIQLNNMTFSDANGTLTFANGKKYRLNPGTTADSLVYLGIYNVVTGIVPSGEQNITGVNTLSHGKYYIIPRSNQDIFSTDGIKENTLENVSVYPNPATDYFVIKSDVPVNVEIYNSIGLLLAKAEYSVGSNTIDRNNLPVGLYTVRIIDRQTGATSNFKLIMK